jgi:DNA mismatch repair protein MutS2
MIDNLVLEKLEFRKVLQYISKYCITEKGKNNTLLISPHSELDKSLLEGKLVDEAKEILIKQYQPPLDYLPSLDEILYQSKIEGAVLDGKKILDILKLAVISRNMTQYLKNNSDIAPGLERLSNSLFVDKVFEHHIQKIITEEGDIKENASPKLLEIRNEIKTKQDELVKSVSRITKNLKEKDIVREDYLTLRDGRIVIPVKAEHKRHIRGFIHSESATGQTVYIEPEETLELNNEIVSLSFAEKREVERILREITKKIGSVSTELLNSLESISYFDSVFARAKYSLEIIGSFPEADNSKPIKIIDARHPILLKKLGRENTVPLNAEIGENKIVVITGPNAGGKTVVLKTIGLLTLLIRSGIHIPASPDSNFHFFEHVLVDIGDEQSIEDDLSTFSSHLSRINNILAQADSGTLVLLDEIGTGTDPAEGAALAAAVLIKLKENNATVFASTHHGSLKLIANDTAGFENAAMEFDNKNLKPTYVFKQGTPGSSYAFEIARRIGLNDDFLSLAGRYLEPDKHKIENFLINIEAKSREVEEKLKKMEIENARLTGFSNLYKQNLERLEKEKKEILKKVKAEADDYLKDINKKVEKVIKELKESKASKEVIKSSQNIIKEIKESNKTFFKEEPLAEEGDREFQVGDMALLKNTNTTGKVIEISEDKKKATLLAGKVKIQVPFSELVQANIQNKVEEREKEYFFTASSPKIRLDIRGERADEAEFEVIKFVDEAYSAGLDRIEILHGKGTGALKKTVKEILSSHEKVKNFYFAPIEIGGDGITIAELK